MAAKVDPNQFFWRFVAFSRRGSQANTASETTLNMVYFLKLDAKPPKNLILQRNYPPNTFLRGSKKSPRSDLRLPGHRSPH
jgi:hypothetical protein